MPEMPEIQAHAERLTDQFSTRVLTGFTPFNFTALKTAVPAPAEAFGQPLLDVGRRGKYLLLRFEPVTFVVHLMQGGRLVPDTKRSAKPRGGQARFVFEAIESADGSIDETALLLTEQGKERTRRRVVPTRPTAHWHHRHSTSSGPRPPRSPTTNSPRCSRRTRCACTASCAISG